MPRRPRDCRWSLPAAWGPGTPRAQAGLAEVRIIGGEHRGRKLHYQGDPRTRPMKDRVREAVFNLLGQDVLGKRAIDLFAGTGVLGLEALSRGAAQAVCFEQHFPTAELIRQNAGILGLSDRVQVEAADTFVWFRRAARSGIPWPAELPWLVFVSPPFDFYVDRPAEMQSLIQSLWSVAPAGSAWVIESDERFDPGELPAADWDVREYPPARIALART